MRQSVPVGRLAWGVGALALALVAAGSPKAKKAPLPVLKQEETIGDLADIISTGIVRVEGIGLVAELDGTGSDPEPGYFREKLLDKMRKGGVHNPDQILRGSKNFSLVLVKATIPMGIGKQDVFDVEVEVPPSSATTSLVGGQLILTELREVRTAKGQALEGQILASAHGPVMIGNAAKPDDLKVGRILGGAKVKKELPYTIVLKERRKSFQASDLVQKIIRQRFHDAGDGDSEGMAKSHTDQVIELRVPHVYHQNQPRYFQVVQLLPVVNNRPELSAERMERWSKELLDPKTSGIAALKLEGVGRNATEPLKAGLASPDARVRFFSAEALAYIGDSAGVGVLGDTAVKQPEYRAYALAALCAMDQPASAMKLRELMSQPDVDLKYGAFNALRAADPHDPHLRRIRVALDEPEPEADDDEDEAAMAYRIRKARRHKAAPDPFELFLIECDGPPVVHIARTRRCEIVLFGRDQKLLTPVVLGGDGAILLNASVDDTKIQISRIAAGRSDLPDAKSEAPLDLWAVIQEMSRMGASYPHILAVLQSAQKQGNLAGQLVVDAVPVQPPAYSEAQLAGLKETPKGKKDDAKKDDAVGRAGLDSKKPAARRSLLDRFRRS